MDPVFSTSTVSRPSIDRASNGSMDMSTILPGEVLTTDRSSSASIVMIIIDFCRLVDIKSKKVVVDGAGTTRPKFLTK